MPLSRNLPPKSHILWLISLIQDTSPEAQTKAEFSEMVDDIIANDNVDKVTLCIGDNLQRFRFMIQNNCTEAEGIERCQQLSRQWHIDNPESLQRLKEKKHLAIIKWDDFLAWPDYEKTVKSVEDLYLKDNKFKRDVDGRIKQELEKLTNTAKITDPTKRTELLKKYLFEESAFQKFVASQGFKFELYKKPLPPAAKRIISNSDFVPPGYLAEVHFTQFNNAPRNTPTNHIAPQQSSPSLNIPIGIDFPVAFSSHKNNGHKNGFGQVFSSEKKSNSSGLSQSPEKKFANFIESTLGLLPEEQRENAIKALMQFTNQQIIPLCYEKDNRHTIHTLGT
ncbi:MAG TPA: hypothetical protein VIH61_06325 [Waddliaceae bacterium]